MSSERELVSVSSSEAYQWVDSGAFLRQIWESARKRIWLILAILASAILMGLFATFLMQPKFTTSARVEISRAQKNITSVDGVEQVVDARDAEFYKTQYALLEAESLATRVARSLDLVDNEEFYESHAIGPIDSSTFLGLSENQIERRREELVVNVLLDNVNVSPVVGSSLVDIQYTSGSAELSQRVANAWVEQFIGATMDRQFASTADAREFLEERLEQLRARLEESERATAAYASDRDIIVLDSTTDVNGRSSGQQTLAASGIVAMSAAVIQARNERIAAESRVGAGSIDTSPEFLASSSISALRAERAKIASQYEKILVQFQPSYDGARALKRELDSLDRDLARERSRFTSSRKSVLREAQAKEQKLQRQLDQLKVQFDTERQNLIQYNIFRRDVDTSRELYDALLQRYKEIGVAGAVGASNIALVDEAKIPRAPSSPNLILNLLFATILGAGLAGATVFVLDQLDDVISSLGDVKDRLGQPVLGSFPKTEENPLELLNDPKSDFYEACVSFCAVLGLSTNRGVPPSLVFSSTSANDGKSTIALGLARTLARSGKQVVLIDGDLRSPSVHSYSGLELGKGLSNLLAGDMEIEQVRQNSGHDNLDIISAGPMPPSPSDLLSGVALLDIVSKLTDRYDHVIIDAPPVLELADVPLMSKAVDGVVYVVVANETARRAARTSLNRLIDMGAKILGVAVTKIDFTKDSYGYGYGYGYGDNND